MVKGGFEAIADEVARLEPDIVLFSEVRNYHGKQFISRILQALGEHGKKYYGENSKLDVGILSKYKIGINGVKYKIISSLNINNENKLIQLEIEKES